MRRRMAASDVCVRGWFADSTRIQKEGEIIVPLFFSREARPQKNLFCPRHFEGQQKRSPLYFTRTGRGEPPPSSLPHDTLIIRSLWRCAKGCEGGGKGSFDTKSQDYRARSFLLLLIITQANLERRKLAFSSSSSSHFSSRCPLSRGERGTKFLAPLLLSPLLTRRDICIKKEQKDLASQCPSLDASRGGRPLSFAVGCTTYCVAESGDDSQTFSSKAHPCIKGGGDRKEFEYRCFQKGEKGERFYWPPLSKEAMESLFFPPPLLGQKLLEFLFLITHCVLFGRKKGAVAFRLIGSIKSKALLLRIEGRNVMESRRKRNSISRLCLSFSPLHRSTDCHLPSPQVTEQY